MLFLNFYLCRSLLLCLTSFLGLHVCLAYMYYDLEEKGGGNLYKPLRFRSLPAPTVSMAMYGYGYGYVCVCANKQTNKRVLDCLNKNHRPISHECDHP